MRFIHLLNECPIVYVPDVEKYGWLYIGGMKDGYEVYSIYGEIKCFNLWHDANRWRIQQIREFMESGY